MKTTTIKLAFGSIALYGALIMTPAFALDATTTSSVKINGDGMVRVTNAEVTSVSGNIINAITRFKNLVTSWTFTTNGSTTLMTNNSYATSTAGLQVGDRFNVSGTLTSFGSTIGVTASKLMENSYLPIFSKTKSGTVESINTSNGTFVMKSGNKLVTVQANASTTIMVRPTATSALVATTLALVPLNSKIEVSGVYNSNSNILTAKDITVKSVKISSDDDKNKKDKKDKKDNHGSEMGWKNGWEDKENRDNNGEHKGFLKLDLDL